MLIKKKYSHLYKNNKDKDQPFIYFAQLFSVRLKLNYWGFFPSSLKWYNKFSPSIPNLD